MDLKLILNQTGLSWTLKHERNRPYTVGQSSDCDVTLPDMKIDFALSLEFGYNSSMGVWYVKDLNGNSGTLVNNQPISDKTVPIWGETRISKLGSQALVAIPYESTVKASPQLTVLETSTRLLSGYAYLGGIVSGLELLNRLRTDPYKAKTPSSSLDIDRIATHASQAVLVSLIFAIPVIAISVAQLLIVLEVGFESDFMRPLAVMAALITAFEMVYLRWLMARQFLNKNYKLKPKIKFLSFIKYGQFLRPVVRFFRKSFMQAEPLQNIIYFGSSNPFVGHGELVPGSNWTVPILRKPDAKKKSAEEFELPIEIPTRDLYQAVDTEIAKLNLPNLQKFSRLFVDGFELKTDGKILTSATARPAVTYVDDPLWVPEQNLPGSKQRAYRVYQYIDVERDYVLSHFLRFYNVGSITFAESAAYILTGIDRRRFSLTSALEGHLLRLFKMLVAAFFLHFGIYALFAIRYVVLFVYNLISWQLNDKKNKKAARFEEGYNYGLEETLREFVAEPLSIDSNRVVKRRDFWQNQVVPLLYQTKGILIKLLPLVFAFFIVSSIMFLLKSAISLLSLNILALIFEAVDLAMVIISGAALFITYGLILMINFFLNPIELSLNKKSKLNLDYYGTQDVLMYWKSIQERIVKTINQVLKRYNVDTSDFEAVTEVINNYGLMIDANSIINQGQIAGGSSSQSTFNSSNAGVPQSPTQG